ncbi:Structure-specific endonuclease subunit slx4 [Pyrenophora seminiperda CCB06]|uniref:Structure-specific endonuclease subunit slx4 n=1 Tax=Pyrenophora seminiperda CCB06 TaxID=1302712 RepID=A0A3M7LV56_9PLEO|nr:Structure-specific endonuclease subunit slx4 [Pyrenophora seminiperda CCB06]
MLPTSRIYAEKLTSTQFFFFDATSHVITAIAGLFFIVSECSLFRNFYARNWPLLSPSHGFVTLGCAMMVVGLNLLGNMNKEATSQKSLTLPFWRLLVASGILAIIIGFFNVIASFVFCDKSRRITARMVRSRGAMTLHEDLETQYDPKHKAFTITTHHTGSTSSRSNGYGGTPPMRMGTPPVDCGSPHMSNTAGSPTNENHNNNNNNNNNSGGNHLGQFEFSPLRGAFRTARQSFLPSYHSSANNLQPPKPGFFSRRPTSSLYSRTTSGGEPSKKFWQRQREEQEEETARMPQISYPLNVNPQFAHLVKPNLAHHPSVRRPEMEYNKI